MTITCWHDPLVRLLPHLDALDLHRRLGPSAVPLVPRIPEVMLRVRTSVYPGLAARSIHKPTVGPPDGHVQDQVEGLIEGGTVVTRLAPGIDVLRSGAVAWREIAAAPERLVEGIVQRPVEARIEVHVDVLLGPLEAEGVEAGGEGRVQCLAAVGGAPPGIVGQVGSPVDRARHDVVTSRGVRVVVTSALDNVNLAGQWPLAVGGVHGHHPDGWPKPISLRHLGHHLDLSVPNRRTLDRVQPGRLDGIDDGAIGDIRSRHTVGQEVRGACAVSRQVDYIVRLDQLLVLQRRFDLEHAVTDEGILVCTGSHVKLTSARWERLSNGSSKETGGLTYPKPPDSTSLVQIFGSSSVKVEKS